MKLHNLAAVFLTLGVGIAGVMAVEAEAERARVAAPPAVSDAPPLRATAAAERGVDADLAGSWRVVGAADEASGGYVPFDRSIVARAMLDIAADGGAQATAGCNRIMATVSQSGSGWHAGPAIMTRMACADPAVMAAEQAIARALSSATSIAIKAGRATLSGASGVTLLVLERR